MSGQGSPPPWVRGRKLLGRIRRRFQVDVFDVFARPVGPDDGEFAAPPGYRYAWAGPEDVARCDPHHTELDERERREGIQRLGFDHRMVAGFHGEEIVFTMWMNPRNVNVPGFIKRRLAADQVFIYKAYTSPEHRGRKLYQAGMRFVLAYLARGGMRELVGYAHVGKLISRRGLAALEFETRGRFVGVDVPGLRRTFVSRALVESFPEALPRSGVFSGAPSPARS